MKNHQLHYRSSVMGISLSILMALSGFTGHAVQAGEISQTPLFFPPPVSPNILFVLDDSGSMKYEILPDDYTGAGTGYAHVFPRAAGVYESTSDYGNYVATIATSSGYGAMVRSSYWNKTFYNPSITYTPWSKWDKTLYPNASPTCALHNPQRPGTGTTYCRDLTVNVTNWGTTYWFSSMSSTSTSTTLPRSDFLAATYYSYDITQGDAGKLIRSNYIEHQIRPDITSYSGEGRDSRTDCTGGVCTYTQEIQNFANWYTYYRSRVLASRAGIGQAFANQPLWENDEDSRLRVGFGAINKGSTTIDGQATSTVIQGLRNFWGTGREAFFTSLYDHSIPAQGTPLVSALNGAGRYYQRSDSQGPWSKTPGTSSSDAFASCRQSYTILMTDGYWNGALATGGAALNNDGTSGPTLTGPPTSVGGPDQSYTYDAVSPFYDTLTNTLADVAMYYWKNDLQPALINRVPVSQKDPAFWQHMVTYGVGLGVTGSVNPDTAFEAIYSGANVTWPNPSGASSTPAKIDDLLHAAVNSRGGFFSAADPKNFARQLAEVLDSINARQNGAAAAISTSLAWVQAGSLIYQAVLESKGSDWSSELRAYEFQADGQLNSTPTWSTDTPGKIPSANNRNIYTIFDNTATGKVEFKWGSLSTTQRADLETQGITQDVIDWLRGDQSKEIPNGNFRKRTLPDVNGVLRTRLLGDIINSNPTYLGEPPDFGYGLLPGYTDFRKNNQNRTKMLYVGANDGMLHAFDALTGEEKFAFIPKASHSHLAKLANPDYAHRYFVDGTPYIIDAHLNNQWKSILIGTMGAGGRSLFALDVTDPDNFDTSKILWEFEDDDLGYTIGEPSIGRLQNGTWVAIFGNGYNSSHKINPADGYDAVLFVVNLETGALIAKIGTGTEGAGTDTSPNGLGSPALVADSNLHLVAAYAGDLKGNLWKFDLTGTLSNATTPVFGEPLFKARDKNNRPQPITAPLEIAGHPINGYMILFGTGKYFEVTDNIAEPTAPVQNTLYGIWDNSILNSDEVVNNGESEQRWWWSHGSAISNRSELLEQVIENIADASGRTWRTISKNPIDWEIHRGWYLDLLPQSVLRTDKSQDLSERVVTVPLLQAGRVFFTTRIQFKTADPCDPVLGTGWFMGMNVWTGGRQENVFDVNGDGKVDEADRVAGVGGSAVSASGLQLHTGTATNPVLFNRANGMLRAYGASGSGEIAVQADISNPNVGRQSWRRLQ